MTEAIDDLPLRIDPAHAALPGHFPGAPVVPGVVVLDEVLAAAERWCGAPLTLRGLPQAKFLAPLLPGEQASIALERDGASLRFRVSRDGTLLAQGAFALGTPEGAT